MKRSRTRTWEVRDRIIALTVGLAALALIAAGFTLWVVERRNVSDNMTATLRRTAVEFDSYTARAVNPQTGLPFTDTQQLLFSAMGNEVPAENEGILGFINGQPRYIQEQLTLNLMDDEAFLQHVGPQTLGGNAFIASHTTTATTYRYVVVPVQVGDTAPGALVIAFDANAAQQTVRDLIRTYTIIATATILLAAGASWILTGRMLRPIRELREISSTITENDLSRRLPVRGDDDVAELARSFNGMVDRLEAAFAGQRQLLDDAGHELRTPITVVRGHLELMDPADPADAAETRDLALGELDRMHRLADDLVLLASTQTPGFLREHPTDVADLTEQAFANASRLGHRDWQLTATARVVVQADGQRLTQAWLQLAANAVKFSPDGSRIELGSAMVGHEIRLWVRDTGVGISPEAKERIFERFGQENPAHGGAGLGLPIVMAIARAHGGTVDVESTLGVGSTFMIRIPARPEQGNSA